MSSVKQDRNCFSSLYPSSIYFVKESNETPELCVKSAHRSGVAIVAMFGWVETTIPIYLFTPLELWLKTFEADIHR